MKILAGILVLAVVTGVAVSGYFYDNRAEIPVFRTVTVMEGDLFVGVTASGTVEPVEIVDVGTQISGRISSFGPDEQTARKTIDYGSKINADGVLAKLDDQPAKAALSKASADLKLAEAELSGSKAKLKQADRAFRRAEQLRGTDSEAEYEKAESEVETARAELAMAEAKVEQAQIAKQQAEIDLGYTVIRSPIDGVVIDRRVNVGQTVVSGMNAPSLFLLAKDLSQMQVWAAVNEADIGKIHLDQSVTFSVDAYPDQTFTGKVNQIRLNASQQQNVVSYGVIVNVDNTDGKLLPYMTAKLEFELARRKDIVLVPNQALRWQPKLSQISPSVLSEVEALRKSASRVGYTAAQSEQDTELKVDLNTPVLWIVADDGLVRPVPVEAGLTDDNVTEIISGEIEPGDTVVINALKPRRADFVSTFIDPIIDKDE